MTIREKLPRRGRPWQRGRARPHHREVVLFDRPPLAQICIYDGCCVLTRRKPDGTWVSYPISPDALAQALGRLPVSTGLLPEGIIGNGLHQGDPFYVMLARPRRVTLLLEDGGKMLSRPIQIPPLIWAGWRTEYRIWALALKPEASIAPHHQLYHAPFPNLYTNGGICWGSSARRATASPATMPQMLKLFLEESRFNSHLANGRSRKQPSNILRAYDKLSPEKPYPLDDLMPSSTYLRSVLSGAVWSGGM